MEAICLFLQIIRHHEHHKTGLLTVNSERFLGDPFARFIQHTGICQNLSKSHCISTYGYLVAKHRREGMEYQCVESLLFLPISRQILDW